MSVGALVLCTPSLWIAITVQKEQDMFMPLKDIHTERHLRRKQSSKLKKSKREVRFSKGSSTTKIFASKAFILFSTLGDPQWRQ